MVFDITFFLAMTGSMPLPFKCLAQDVPAELVSLRGAGHTWTPVLDMVYLPQVGCKIARFAVWVAVIHQNCTIIKDDI